MGLPDAATLTERKVRAKKTFHALSASCVFDESKIFPPIKFLMKLLEYSTNLKNQLRAEIEH